MPMRLATTKTREEATTNKSVREPIEGKRASVMSSVELNPVFHKSFIKVNYARCLPAWSLIGPVRAHPLPIRWSYTRTVLTRSVSDPGGSWRCV